MMITDRKIQMKRQLESLSFAECVYTMLEDAAAQGFEDIIRWEADGRSFKVYNINDFERHVQPVYLNQSRLRSFQRKLVAHGFTCIPGGPSRGAYRHDMFVRGCKESCKYIEQVKTGSPTSTSICNASPSSLSLKYDLPLVGGDRSLLVGDTAPPLSAHFWKAVLDSKPAPTTTSRAGLSAKVDDHYQEGPPSLTSRSFVPLVAVAKKKPSPAMMDNDSKVVVDEPMTSLLITSSQQTTTASPPGHDDDHHLVPPLPLAGPSAQTTIVTPTMLMRCCPQATPITNSCFLLDPDEPLMLPSSVVASSINQTSIPVPNGNNLNKKKGITDSMSFSLFSMELDEILLDDLPTKSHTGHQISSRDTLSLQESILCGSWRERLLTTDEDDNEDASFQDFLRYESRAARKSSSSSEQSSIWSESIMSR